MDKGMREVIGRLEDSFIEETWFSGGESFEILEGNVPILVSAPHSVEQWRLGKTKAGEYRTGVLAQLLHKETGSYGSYKTKNMGDDANYDEESDYRDALIHLIKDKGIRYVLDLHIMSPKRDHLVDIGTGYGVNIQHNFNVVNEVRELFQAQGIREVEVDKVFSASYPYTVSAYVAKECDIVCIQIELNWRLLDTEDSEEGFHQVFHSLVSVIEALQEEEMYEDHVVDL